METTNDFTNDGSRLAWEPIPKSKCPQLASAGSMVEGYVKVILFFGGLGLSILVCVALFGRAAPLYKDPVWWVCAVVMSIGPFLFVEWLLKRRHARKLLSIDQDQVSFGGRSVQLAELKSISPGQFKVIMERYFPSLEKAAVMVNKPLSGAEMLETVADARQNLRDQSLTLTRHDGKQVHWIGAMAFFAPADLEAFFAALRQRKPELEIEVKPFKV